MKRVAILSDTHGVLREEVMSILENIDYIVDVVIFGHSHRYKEDRRDGVLWLNPGSCGKRRFGYELSMVLMIIEAGRYQYEKIVICEGK